MNIELLGIGKRIVDYSGEWIRGRLRLFFSLNSLQFYFQIRHYIINMISTLVSAFCNFYSLIVLYTCSDKFQGE